MSFRRRELLLSLKGHFEEFVPRLAILTHLAHLEPLALLGQFDDVSHPATLLRLNPPLQRTRANLRLGIRLSPLGGERAPAKRLAALIIRDQRQRGVNRRSVLLGLSQPSE